MKKIKRRYKLLNLCLLILISGCTINNKNEDFETYGITQNKSVSLQKVGTILLKPGDELIGKFREDLSIDNTGEIISFADDNEQEIFLFKRNGELINILGKKGQGPKEFLQISAYSVYNREVIVVDESQSLIKIFDLEGNLKRTFSLFENTRLFINSREIIVHGDTIYLQILEAGYLNDKSGSKLVVGFDLFTGEITDLIGQFDPFLDQIDHHLSLTNISLTPDNSGIASVLTTSSRIQIFNLNSDVRTHYFGLESPDWNPISEKIEPSMPRHVVMERALGNSYSTGLYFSNNYLLHHFQNMTESWFNTNDYLSKENYLNVFDYSKFEYYGTIILPGTLGDVYGDICFIIEDYNPDNFIIGEYEVQID